MDQDSPSSDSEPNDQPPSSGALIIHSKDLLQGRREIWIEHGQEMYRLRLTANDKLYLTK